MVCNYFTKWVEAEALSQVIVKHVRGFMYNNIIVKFGVPHTLIMDNRKQFNYESMQAFCATYSIMPKCVSISYPQANGQVERTNRTIKESIEKRVDWLNDKWADELPSILWGYRMTRRSPAEESPFRMAFGTEAVLPIELEIPNFRVQRFDKMINEVGMRTQLDGLEEIRETA